MASTPQGWLSGGHQDRLAQVNATLPSLFHSILLSYYDNSTFFSDMCIGTTLKTDSL